MASVWLKGGMTLRSALTALAIVTVLLAGCGSAATHNSKTQSSSSATTSHVSTKTPTTNGLCIPANKSQKTC
jgi:uncharacterized protein YceK